MSAQLKITNAVKDNRLKATEMAVGESVVAVFQGFEQGKYGNNILLNISGSPVTLYPAGNLKFLQERVERNEIAVGDTLTITRSADAATKKGFITSRFDIASTQEVALTASPVVAAAKTTKEKLAEIQAKRTN